MRSPVPAMLSALRHRSRQLAAFLATAIPSFCALCGANSDSGICQECRNRFFSRELNRCGQCADALPDTDCPAQALCGRCLKNPPAFDATIVAADYAPPADQLVLSLKFSANLALAPLFSMLLADAFIAAKTGLAAMPTLLTAVPLAPQRLQERGFNQALEIAKPLSRLLTIPLDPHLALRVRETDAQALLHPKERRKNIRHAFAVPNDAAARIEGRHIAIVDDVITTGETMNELAAVFKRFGAASVVNLVFARTPP